VVALAKVVSAQSARIDPGCQSSYLKGIASICPKSGWAYLDGTFAASQNGTLPDVDITATNIPSQYGGLDVSFSTDSDDTETAGHSKDKQKMQKSVRDLKWCPAGLRRAGEIDSTIFAERWDLSWIERRAGETNPFGGFFK
jgi:hypothetical protein